MVCKRNPCCVKCCNECCAPCCAECCGDCCVDCCRKCCTVSTRQDQTSFVNSCCCVQNNSPNTRVTVTPVSKSAVPTDPSSGASRSSHSAVTPVPTIPLDISTQQLHSEVSDPQPSAPPHYTHQPPFSTVPQPSIDGKEEPCGNIYSDTPPTYSEVAF